MIPVSPERIRTYVQRRQQDIDTLSQSLERGSIESFNLIGHRLAGSAGTFGFPDLEKLGQEMEGMTGEAELRVRGPAILLEMKAWIQASRKFKAHSAVSRED